MENIVALTHFFKKLRGTKNWKMTILSNLRNINFRTEQIMIIVEYLPSSLNKEADLESLRKVDSSEWVLCQLFFCNLCLKLRTSTVDLFASRVSNQVAQHVAWKSDPYSIATDAMSIPWTQGRCCAFPHFV